MRPLTKTVNMNHADLKAWLANPRYMLASTPTGHESLRRLAAGDHYRDPHFADKADKFNTRHMLSGHLFGQEVGKSGWSKRHIALKNWGHDPSKPDSPLYDADQVWLSQHAGAEQRRGNRIANPIVIAAIEGEGVADFRDLAPFLCPTARPCKPQRTRGSSRVTFVPDDHLYGDGEVYSDMPFGSNHSIKFGLLKQKSAPRVSASAKRVGEAAFDQIMEEAPRLDRGCMCQLAPAAMQGLAQRFDRFDRKPNPAIGAWILPIAQLLVSASGLYYSLSHLGDLASASMMSPEDKLIADMQNLRQR